MEYVIEDPSSDTSTMDSAQSPLGTTEHEPRYIVAQPEPALLSPTLEEPLRSDEAFLKQTSKNQEQLREADLFHHTHERRAEEEESQLAQLAELHAAAQSQASTRATETERLSAEIRNLSQAASEQIDRMDQAKARLAILEELRIHAETRVCERAEREIRLEAEIDALRQIEATQDQRIEAAEEEVRRLTEEQTRVQAAAEARQREEAEARKQVAAEAAQKAADEARRLAEEEGQELERLEAIRAKAEVAAHERSEKERLLNSQLLAFGEAAAEQLERITTAEADLIRVETEFQELEERARQTVELAGMRASEAENRRQTAADEVAHAEAEAQSRVKEEEHHLAELEAIRTQLEAETEQRAEIERRLSADIAALRETEAEQLNRIEIAEADLRRLEEELLYLEERARQTAEQLAGTEVCRQATANEVAQAEAEAQAIVREEEQNLSKLEDIRTQAQAEAEKLAEVERQLNADIEALREAEARQRRRIEKAKTVAQLVSEEQTELLRIAKEEEQRLIELESARKEFETTSQLRYEEEQRLIAQIEALRKTQSEQLNRIADAEVALRTREEELRSLETDISQNQVEPQIGSVMDIYAESEMWPGDLQSETADQETATQWSSFEPFDQSNEMVAEGFEFLRNDVEDTENLTAETAAEGSAKATDSVAPIEVIQTASLETPLTNSLVERLSSGDHDEYANVIEELGNLDDNTAFDLITGLFDDLSEEVRNAAARALFDLSKERTDFFTRALREASPERSKQIVTAVEASGIVDEAIDSLAGESREKTHDAFTMLFLMAKAGEVQSLFQTIEKHPNIQVRLSVIKLLTFTNRPDLIPPLRSLAVRGALPIEVRSALMKSIYEMSSANRERSLSAA